MEKRWIAVVAGAACTAVGGAGTITVDDDGSADFNQIQAAVDFAVDGDQIIVAPGVYTSSQPGHVLDLQGKRIAVKSLEGPEATIIDGQGVRRGLACFKGESQSTTVEGFTIRNGYAASFDYDGDGQGSLLETNGGGLYNHGSSPTIRNCVFIDNSSPAYGGAIFNGNGSNANIQSSQFSWNIAAHAGGAISNNASSPIINECTFQANASPTGAALNNNLNSNAVVTDCIFVENHAMMDGGAMHNANQSNVEISGCTFENNSAAYLGGAIKNWSSSPTIEGCSILHNEALLGGGIWSGLGGNPVLASNDLCGNTPSQIHGNWTDQGGNSIEDECVDSCPGDINDDGIVSGIDVTIVLASWQLSGVAADINGDGIVNGADLTIVLAAWGPCP